MIGTAIFLVCFMPAFYIAEYFSVKAGHDKCDKETKEIAGVRWFAISAIIAILEFIKL